MLHGILKGRLGLRPPTRRHPLQMIAFGNSILNKNKEELTRLPCFYMNSATVLYTSSQSC